MIDETTLKHLEELAHSATPGHWEGISSYAVLIIDGSPFDLTDADNAFIAACSPDTILGLVQRVRAYETLKEIVQRETDYYDQGSLEEQAKDDHMNTMDHKDELSVSESLLVIKAALTPTA